MISIRPWRTDDAQTLHELADDAAVARWMSGFPHPYPLTLAHQWLADAVKHDPPQFFAIEFDGIPVGGGGIEPLEGTRSGVAILGYWLTEPYWGRGIATAALQLLVDRAFADGYRRLQAHVYAPNTASARVLEKCGFTLEARLRQSYLDRDGKPCDELIYGRLVAD